MKRRKGILVERATVRELLRYKIERVASHNTEYNLSEEGKALAEMCKALDYLNERLIVRVIVFFYSFVGIFVFIAKTFQSKR